jgi:hypothetical protein
MLGCLAGEKATKVHVLFAQVSVAQRARVVVKRVYKVAEISWIFLRTLISPCSVVIL